MLGDKASKNLTGEEKLANKIKNKIFCTLILITLIVSIIAMVMPASALPIVDSNAKVNLKGSKTLTLTASDIASMPTYTGVGSPRRNAGAFPLQMLGNYTGVPLLYLCNLVGGISGSSMVTVSTTFDGYFSALDFTKVHDNQFVQFNITTHQMITGQNPIMILAYGVNGTTLTSDGTNTDTDLGGPLRLIVVANNGSSPILANDGMATYGMDYVKFVTDIEITNPGSLTFQTCDGAGVTKGSFKQGDGVYFGATGLSASTTYPVYVVKDVSAWAVRIDFPARVSGSATTVSTDSSGNIAVSSIYANAQPGTYDVLVDVNNNGKYDEADLLINNVVTTKSISNSNPASTSASASPSGSPSTSPAQTSSPTPTVPEFPSIILLMAGLVAATTAMSIYLRKKQSPAQAGINLK